MVTAETEPVDHAGLSVMTFDDCLRSLRSRPVGRIAFAKDGDIEILPVNYCVVNSTVGFRTAQGTKVGAALDGSVVAFEVDEVDEAGHDGWSVVIKGRLELVLDEELVARLEATGLAPWADTVPRPEWVVIHADSITGRRVRHR